MDNFSPNDVVLFLKENCPDVDDSTFDIIKNEKLSGKRAMKLDLSGWKNVGISFGEAVDITGAIDSLKCGLIQFVCEKDRGTFDSSNKENFNPSPSQGKCGLIQFVCEKDRGTFDSSNKENFNPSPSQGTSEDESGAADQDPKKDYSAIEKYFTPQAFNEMSDYEKDSYLNQLVQYEKVCTRPELKELVIPMPIFMKDKTANKKTSQKKETPNKTQIEFSRNLRSRPSRKTSLEEGHGASTSKVNAGASTSKVDAGASTSKVDAGASTSKVDAGASTSKVDAGASTPQVDAGPPTAQVESSNHNAKKKKKSLDNPPVEVEFNLFESDMDSTNESDPAAGTETPNEAPNEAPKEATKKRRRRRKNTLQVNLSEADLIATLPKFDILKIISGKKLKPMREALQTNGILVGTPRKLLMRTLTRYLYYTHVTDIKLVTSDMKSGMAASLVDLFPQFKDKTDPNKRSWWRVFDPTGPSGFIANCSSSILRSHDSKDRPRGGGQGTVYYTDSESESDSPKIIEHPEADWMKIAMPWPGNKAKLLNGMEASFKSRREWIVKKSPTVTEIICLYPHLMSYDCEILEKEFSLICPDKEHNFTKVFPHLVQSLKASRELSEVELLSDGANKDILGACLTMAEMLPRPNLKKKQAKESVMPDLKNIIVMVPLGTNVQELVELNRRNAKGPVQPYLLALVPQTEITKMFIVADSQLIQLATNSALKGLDILLKAYHVFNVAYPLAWGPLCEMLENGVYQVSPAKLTNSAIELLKIYKIIK